MWPVLPLVPVVEMFAFPHHFQIMTGVPQFMPVPLQRRIRGVDANCTAASLGCYVPSTRCEPRPNPPSSLEEPPEIMKELTSDSCGNFQIHKCAHRSLL